MDGAGSRVELLIMESVKGARKAPTSRDVAALAGVAQSTVSLVINGGAATPETRLRVERAMRMLGYQPNAGARALRTSKSRVIALIVHLEAQDDPTETVPYIDSIVEYARTQDYDVLLSPLREGTAGLSRMAARNICDGFILMDVEARDARVAVAAQLNVPTVLVGRPLDAQGLDVVDFDSRRAAELLVDELAETGSEHLVVFEDPPEDSELFLFKSEFLAGAKDRAAHHGLPIETISREGEGWSGVRAVSDRLLGDDGRHRGIIVRTPRDTQWMMTLFQLNGLVPGRDISLASRCTDEVATGFPWPVTNLSPRPREMTDAAMSMLFDRLAGNAEAERLELVPPQPVTRRATTANVSA